MYGKNIGVIGEKNQPRKGQNYRGNRHHRPLRQGKRQTDAIGPRLAGGPAFKEAADWAVENLRGWDLDTQE